MLYKSRDAELRSKELPDAEWAELFHNVRAVEFFVGMLLGMAPGGVQVKAIFDAVGHARPGGYRFADVRAMHRYVRRLARRSHRLGGETRIVESPGGWFQIQKKGHVGSVPARSFGRGSSKPGASNAAIAA